MKYPKYIQIHRENLSTGLNAGGNLDQVLRRVETILLINFLLDYFGTLRQVLMITTQDFRCDVTYQTAKQRVLHTQYNLFTFKCLLNSRAM